MKEDRLDELIDAAARDYHRPGDVPRERMWERVQAARSAAVGTEIAAPRRRRVFATWASAALAAAAMLAIGIGIGRRMERNATPRGGGIVATTATPDTAGRVASASPTAPAGASAGASTGATAIGREGAAAMPQAQNARRVASADRARERAASAASMTRAESAPDAASLPYRAELAEHFAATDALLTSFRAAARTGHGRMDPQLASWTRDLLTTTRMLQASAPTDDPTMKRLLDDLELVLMQISEYTAGDRHRAEDARLIEQAIERHAVMTRLRTIPAGLTSPGT